MMMMDFIMRLRKLELPLEEITNILNVYEPEETKAVFRKQEKLIDEKIRQLKREKNMLIDQYMSINDILKNMNKFVVRDAPAIICKDIITTAEAATEHFAESGLDVLPVLSVRVKDFQYSDESYGEKFVDPITRADETELFFSALDRNGCHNKKGFPRENFTIISEGKALYFAEKMKIHEDYSAIDRIARYIRENNLSIKYPPIIRMIANQDTTKYDYYEYWVPLK